MPDNEPTEQLPETPEPSLDLTENEATESGWSALDAEVLAFQRGLVRPEGGSVHHESRITTLEKTFAELLPKLKRHGITVNFDF
jgi:hypothetical protein